MVVGGVPSPATNIVDAESSSNEDAIDGAALNDVVATSDVPYRSEGSMGSCERPRLLMSRPLLGEDVRARVGAVS